MYVIVYAFWCIKRMGEELQGTDFLIKVRLCITYQTLDYLNTQRMDMLWYEELRPFFDTVLYQHHVHEAWMKVYVYDFKYCCITHWYLEWQFTMKVRLITEGVSLVIQCKRTSRLVCFQWREHQVVLALPLAYAQFRHQCHFTVPIYGGSWSHTPDSQRRSLENFLWWSCAEAPGIP